MTNAAIINLREVGEVDAHTILTGPLRRVRLARLEPDQSEKLVADTQEHTMFTVSGTGVAKSGSAVVPLRHGVAVTLPLGGSVTIEAGLEGLELFIVSLAVPTHPEGSR
ncbi:MAG: hypothetical protein ACRD0K_13875 [Egibacteraceae bacterium]